MPLGQFFNYLAKILVLSYKIRYNLVKKEFYGGNKYMNHDPILETERLILRRFRLEDAKSVAKHCNNPSLTKWTKTIPYPYSEQDAINYIKSNLEAWKLEKTYTFAIVLKETDELIGSIAITHDAKNHNGELGYWIAETYWGKGYATEASLRMIQFAFEAKGYHRIYARHMKPNVASGRVMQKCGMVLEGELKDHVYQNGQYVNMMYYGIINQ